MISSKKTTWFFSLLMAGLLFTWPSSAGEPSTAGTAGNSSTAFKTGNVESGMSVGTMPTLTAAQPAKALEDRAQSSAAAVAMALSAASQQKIGCFMMMNEARKEEDKSDKALMMAMAMQMCSQADQTMANAYQNKKGYKMVSGSDVPKQAELKVGAQGMSKDKVSEATVPKITYLDSDGGIDPGKGQSPQPTLPPSNLSVFEEPQGEAPKVADPPQIIEDPDGGLIALAPINNAQLSYDDTSKQPNPSTSDNLIGASGGGSNNRQNTSQGSSDTIISSKKEGKDRTSSIRTISADGDSSSGSDGKSGESSRDYNSMLSELLNGGKSQGSNSGMDSNQIILLPGKAKADDDIPNIFQYAAFRFQKLAYEKGRVKHKPISKVSLPKRSAIARASKEYTTPVKSLDVVEE